ncbi:MAG TPA: hypothetical protein PLP27_11420 [Crocinitomicaceae bacterium]|nr:hypothetical protein [Crocinitomicaceae bacterium]
MNKSKYIIAFIVFTLYLVLPTIYFFADKELRSNLIVLVEEETPSSVTVTEKDLPKKFSVTDFIQSELITRQLVKNVPLECINFYTSPFIGLVSPPPEMYFIFKSVLVFS